MRETRILYDAKHNPNKTEAEELMLSYHRKLALISETLVDYDKCHTTGEGTIRGIRKILGGEI